MSSANILLFKTNIFLETDKQSVYDILTNHEGILKWSIDMEDPDKILRIITHNLTINNIVDMLADCGYQCEEL